MPLASYGYPGKAWKDIPLNEIPTEIHAYYELNWVVVAVKMSPDGRIVIFFDDAFNENTEVWQTLDSKWVHVGRRKRA